MKLVSLKCPNCSGAVSFNEGEETVECEYCGKQLHFREEVDNAQKANAAGIQEYTDRIYDLIRQEDYVSAGSLADEGLKTFPYSGRLHLSLLLAELNLKKPSLLGKVGKDYTNSIHYQNCLRYMTEEDQKDLLSLVELNKTAQEESAAAAEASVEASEEKKGGGVLGKFAGKLPFGKKREEAPAPVSAPAQSKGKEEVRAEKKEEEKSAPYRDQTEEKEEKSAPDRDRTQAPLQNQAEPRRESEVPPKIGNFIKGFGIAGFVLGLLSFYLGYFFCVVPAIGLSLSIVCVVKMNKYKMKNGLYLAGLILNCIFLALYGIYFLTFI